MMAQISTSSVTATMARDDEGASHTGVVQGVKPSSTGAVLVIDGEDVPSGFVQRVE